MSKERFDVISFDGGIKVVKDLNGEFAYYEDIIDLENKIDKMSQLLKEIDEHVLYMPYEYSFYKNRIKEFI